MEAEQFVQAADNALLRQPESDILVERIRHDLIPELAASPPFLLGEEGGSTRVVIQAADNGKLLIGKNGQNLKAMEHILRIVCLRKDPEIRAVVLDVNNYRQERVQELF